MEYQERMEKLADAMTRYIARGLKSGRRGMSLRSPGNPKGSYDANSIISSIGKGEGDPNMIKILRRMVTTEGVDKGVRHNPGEILAMQLKRNEALKKGLGQLRNGYGR